MSQQPNVLVFITHDTGRHLGCYGIEQVYSPHIDRIAQEGVRFDRFFATAPMCSPSRAAMFSGLHPQANGVLGLTHSPWYWKYKNFRRHISHYFRNGGYRTVAAGVIHEVYHPEILGELAFDEHLVGNQASDIIRNVCPKLKEMAVTGKPFYMQVGTFQTHSPYGADGVTADTEKGVYVPPLYVDNDKARKEFAALQGSIRHVDGAVEKVLDTLDETGLADNTIVVFTVDHGIAFPRAKTTLYDPGLGTALLIRWPAGGIRGGKVCDHLLSNIDLTPTLLDLAGVKIPKGLHGISFAESCRNVKKKSGGRKAIFAEHTQPSTLPDTRCIRTDRWKLIRHFFPARMIAVPVDLAQGDKVISGPKGEAPVVELYDLKKDPRELTNLSGDRKYASTVKDLSRQLMKHMKSVDDPILKGPTRWPYYEKSMADFVQSAKF